MSIFQDLRYAFRMLAKSPWMTCAALVTLALGIGATTAIFSVINGVLLRPLPYKDPERLVALWQSNPQTKTPRLPASAPNLADWREQSQSFESMSGSVNQPLTITLEDPEQVPGCIVAQGFFDVLGVRAARGRLIAGRDPSLSVAVLSWAAWERRFGKDPNILGRKLVTSMGNPVVVGVLPGSYRQPGLADGDKEPEIWIPFDVRPLPRETALLSVVGRLKPGVSVEQARTEMAGIGRRLAAQYTANKGTQLETVRLKDVAVGPVRRPLWLLLGAVAVLLLCACANVANLLLARSIERRREFAIRAALGSSRPRLFRQVITEGLLLSVAGGALGVLLANLGVEWLVTAAGALIPRSELVQVDGPVLLFTLAVSCLTGLAFACVPAFASSRADLNAALKNGGRTGSEGAHRRTRSLLVASEIALALVLLAGAGLLMRSFWRVLKIDLGYAPEHVLTAEVPDAGGPARNPNFLPELLARLKTAPGVQAAGAARALPLAFDLAPMQTFDIVGGPAPKPDEIREAVVGVATPGYFRAMQIALRGGRFFDERDGPQAPNVAVVNEAFVRRYFPKEDPIGRTLNVAPQLQAGDAVSILAGRSTIVGVVADVRQSDVLAVPKPQIWNPYGQHRWLTMTLAIRTAGDPKQLAGLLRSELRSVDKTVPLTNIRTAEEYYSRALAQRRLSMILLAVLAAVALVMSAVGAYGVIAYSVTQRRQEIGVRMALGAGSGDVIRMVVRQGLATTAAGLAIGLPAALAATRLLGSLLYEVRPHDPLTFACLVLAFGAVAFVASYLPARKAAGVSPLESLRLD